MKSLKPGLFCLIFAAPLPVYAASMLEEVTVTAQKREQSAQDVSIAISAFSGDQLRALGVKSAKEISAFTVGVEINEEYGNATTFTIRGINTNDFYATSSPTAAVYVDGIYKASNINSGSQMFDIERIEILKGPQGTLYGRNVTGGAVSVISKAPTEEWDGYVEASYGSFNRAVIEGAIGGSLSKNIKFRLSGQLQQDDGQFDNVQFPGQPDPRDLGGAVAGPGVPKGTVSGFEKDIGELDYSAVRGQLLYEPSEGLSLHFRAHFARDESINGGTTSLGTQGPNCGVVFAGGVVQGGTSWNPRDCVSGTGYSDPDPFDDEISNDFTPTKSTEIFGASLTVEWQTDLGKVVSITGYEGFDRHGGLDADGTPLVNVSAIYNQEHNQYSQELRLEGETENDRLFYVLGLYYSDDEIKNADDDLSLRALAAGGALGVFSSVIQDTEHSSVFGQVEYDINDTLKIIGGLRWSYESKDMFHEDLLGFPIPGVALLSSSEAVPGLNRRSSKDLSYRAGLEWRPQDGMMLYFNHARGVKSGGWNQLAQFTQDDLTEFHEEVLKSYEFGWKWDVSDTLRFNGALFYYDYEKPQSLVGVDTGGAFPSFRLLNLEEADQLGLELEAVWAPIEGLEILATAALFDSEISTDDPLIDGNNLAFSPEESYSIIGRYEWPVGDSFVMSAQVSASYTGDHFPDTFNVFFEEQDYENIGARIAFGSVDGKWELALWGKNLTDDLHIINSFGTPDLNRGIFLSEPRSAGVTLNYNFF